MRLLLIGATGSPYYEHCKHEVRDFLRSSNTVGLVSAANLFDEEQYFRAMDERLTESGIATAQRLVHIRWNSRWKDALDRADAVVVPGGNTYALLQRLAQSGLLDALQDRVRGGLPYVGSSAGANLAGPNILTTNDWNVVGLGQFQAMGLVPFNINPHYVERSATDAPNSESRDFRIREYHQIRRNPVIGIEETAILNVSGGQVQVTGRGRVKLFTQQGLQRWFTPGEKLEWDAGTRLPEAMAGHMR
jgi:dipeptidase E